MCKHLNVRIGDRNKVRFFLACEKRPVKQVQSRWVRDFWVPISWRTRWVTVRYVVDNSLAVCQHREKFENISSFWKSPKFENTKNSGPSDFIRPSPTCAIISASQWLLCQLLTPRRCKDISEKLCDTWKSDVWSSEKWAKRVWKVVGDIFGSTWLCAPAVDAS